MCINRQNSPLQNDLNELLYCCFYVVFIKSECFYKHFYCLVLLIELVDCHREQTE